MRLARRTLSIALVALGVAAPAVAQDFRDTRAHAPVALSQAQRALRTALGAQGVVELDPATGTPRAVLRLDGFLTEPSRARPQQVAMHYVVRHLAAFGLRRATLAQFRLARVYRDVGGTTHLTWSQSFRGVPAFDNALRAAVTKDGRLLNVGGSPSSRLVVPSVRPRLGAAAALAIALRSVGAALAPVAIVSTKKRAPRLTTFAGGSSAGLVIFAGRLAWQVETPTYRTVLDARTGSVLWQANLVRAAARGLVWEYFPSPLVPRGGNLQQLRDFSRWGTSPSALRGSYAHVYSDVDDDDAPDTPTSACPECGEIPPNAAGPTWSYLFAPIASPAGHCSALIPCSWSSATAFSWRRNLRQDATQVYYYVSKFHDHLRAAPIGFTPAAGNFEGGDAVQAQIDDGADTGPARGFPDESHISNANFHTTPDGQPPRMQMYLFTPRGLADPTPDVNGGDEADVVYHEYTHGLSSRLVTNARGQEALNAPQSRAMGEGWSDWYALDFVNAEGYKPDGPVVGDLTMYYFVSGGNPRAAGLRTEALDCTPGAPAATCPGRFRSGSGGYTFGDYGRICTCGVEPHADGEIWGQTLWQLRQRLGSTKAESLVTRGMELTPPEPSFLDARNGIVQADVANFGGADLAAIWQVFAQRGMGFYASVVDGEDAHPIQNFDSPPASTAVGAISGVVRDAHTRRPLRGARIYIGGHREFTATTAANGRFAIRSVPLGVYPQLIVFRAGFDRRIFRVAIRPRTLVRNVALTRNWAALASGVRITAASRPNLSDFGCGPAQALDQRPGTGWLSAAPSDVDFHGPKVLIVRLRKPIALTGFVLTSGAPCVGDPASGVGRFRIDVSRNGRAYTRAAAGRLRKVDVPVNVRAARARGVRFVRLTMLAPRGRTPYMGIEEISVHGRS